VGTQLFLELKGINYQENQYMKLNQFHTFKPMFHYPITIKKDNWDSFHFNIINEISNPSNDVEIVAFVMDEGIAHLCYVRSSITLIK
jgi:protein pelota